MSTGLVWLAQQERYKNEWPEDWSFNPKHAGALTPHFSNFIPRSRGTSRMSAEEGLYCVSFLLVTPWHGTNEMFELHGLE